MGVDRWDVDTSSSDWEYAMHRAENGSFVLAADHDCIVDEAETRGWNAAIEAVPHSEICLSLDPDADERDCDCYHRIVVAALRRPEVEG